MRDGGKGDKPRPLGVSKEVYDAAWDRIFKEKDGSLTVTIGKNDGLCEVRIEKLPTDTKKPSGSV